MNNLKSTVEVEFQIINPGESVTLEPNGQLVQIVQGKAWITMGKHDFVLQMGQQAVLHNRNTAVVSAVGDERLIFSTTDNRRVA